MVPVEVIGMMGLASREPVPGADKAFIDYATERGWKVGAEWSPEHVDDDGEVYPACWFVMLYRIGPCGSNESCYCAIDLSEHAYARGYPEYWRALCDLADGEWERICERARASSNGASE